jgi:hypothetical protein
MISIMLFIVGCSFFPFAEEPPKTPDFFVHQIQKGETLGMLARWYTGDEHKWREFFIRARTTDSDNLRVGDEIVIPGGILQRLDSPTREFVARYTPKASSSSRTAARVNGGSKNSENKSEEQLAPSEETGDQKADVNDGDSESSQSELEAGFLGRIISQDEVAQ